MADAFVACAFFYARGAGPAAGSDPLPEMGAGTSACGGVRHFARDGVRHFVRDGGRHFVRGGVRPPLSEMGSGTSACGGVRHFARDGVRHLCLRWGLTPEGIVTYLHLRFILRCFIIVGAGGSTNIA